MVKEIEDTNSISIRENDEEYSSALDSLGLDRSEVEDEAFVNFKVDKEVSKKVTKLTHFAMSFRMNLEGKTYDEEKGGYRQTSKSIAGQRIINKMSGVLNSFSTESNLLTQKDINTFVVQYADACRKIETELLRDRSVSEKNTRLIFKMFKDTLFNIGEVIVGSKDNMKAVFGKIEEMQKNSDEGVNF